MDTASANVVTFLTNYQDRMAQLGELSQVYMRAGAAKTKVATNLSGRPFTVHGGESATAYDGGIAFALYVWATEKAPEYELLAMLCWRDDAWVIETEVWVEADNGGSTLLRELPPRTATDLTSCLAQLEAAIADFPSFKDCVFTR